MADAFPELRAAHGGANVTHVQAILREEEESFGRTLDRGIKLFDEAAEYAVKHHHGKISGEDAFKLHDTYGFPIDLTELMAEERGLTVNIGEYEQRMEAARELARAASGGAGGFDMNIAQSLPPTDDAPKYEGLDTEGELLGYLQDGHYCNDGDVPFGGMVALVLDRTCFYGEQGGQVGDTGVIEATGETPGAFDVPAFRVIDTKRFGETVLHIGEAVESEFPLKVGDRVCMEVDEAARSSIMQNHTATHLLNWALREVLGDGVEQKGSLVDAEKTRFDFSHTKPLTPEEVGRVEDLVNEQVAARHKVYTQDVPQEEARRINTLRAVFGEKYPDIVRVVSIGADIRSLLADPDNPEWMQYSVEFCGGTHLPSAGEVGRFVLTSEEGVAKGVRRVVGISGSAASAADRTADELRGRLETLEAAVSKLGTSPQGGEGDSSGNGFELSDGIQAFQKEFNDAVLPGRVRHALRDRLTAVQKAMRQVEKRQQAASGEQVMDRVASLLASAETVNGVTLVVGQVPSATTDALRSAVDWVRNKTESSAVFLAAADGEKVVLIAGMSKDAVKHGLKAGDVIKAAAPAVGGRGGGRPDMAQGGGTDISKIGDAVATALASIKAKL